MLRSITLGRTGMAELFVCLTFDHDNVSGAIARGNTTPTAMSRGEFGEVGAERILATLARHDVPSTWFIPGHTIESYPSSAAAVPPPGPELGLTGGPLPV